MGHIYDMKLLANGLQKILDDSIEKSNCLAILINNQVINSTILFIHIINVVSYRKAVDQILSSVFDQQKTVYI